MTGHMIRVTRLYTGAYILEAFTGEPARDPVRMAAAWTERDASESFHTLIDAMRYPT